MTITSVILMLVFCAVATFFFYGLWLIESDNDEFRKKHGYKPKYHYRRKEKNDTNQDQ